MTERLLLEEELRQSQAFLDRTQVDVIADVIMDLVERGMLARAPGVNSRKRAGTSAGGRSALCGPGDEADVTKDRFLVKFEDPDVHDQAFDDEATARAYFDAASENWNCYLYQLMERRTG